MKQDDLGGWLQDARGTTPLSTVAQRAGCSRFAVSRFLHGKAEPRLPTFLRLVDAISGRASDLCAALVDIGQVPALEASHRKRRAARLVAFEEPWTEAILRVLETPAYQRGSGEPAARIAAQLGLADDDVARCLSRLVEAGLVEHDGRDYVGTGALTVDTQAAPELLRHVRAHWTRVALSRIEHAREGDEDGHDTHVLCEINVSAVLPFPDAALPLLGRSVAESIGR